MKDVVVTQSAAFGTGQGSGLFWAVKENVIKLLVNNNYYNWHFIPTNTFLIFLERYLKYMAKEYDSNVSGLSI